MNYPTPSPLPVHSMDVICHHEAGHSVMVIACGGRVKSIIVEPEPYTSYEYKASLPKQCLILISAAGGAAHFILKDTGVVADEYITGDISDQKTAQSFLSELGHSGAYMAYLIKARKILQERWEAVTRLAKLLLIQRVATQADIEKFIPAVAKLDVNRVPQEMIELIERIEEMQITKM